MAVLAMKETLDKDPAATICIVSAAGAQPGRTIVDGVETLKQAYPKATFVFVEANRPQHRSESEVG